MIDVRLSTRDDIRHVVFRMWRRGEEEIKRITPEYSPEALVKILCDCSNEYGYAIYFHGEPIAVFGAYPAEGLIYRTWFAATDKFHHIGRAATKYLKNLVKVQTEDRPGIQLQLWSAVDHPLADRWFKFLGFTPIEPEGAFTRYAYTGKRLTDSAESTNIA